MGRLQKKYLLISMVMHMLLMLVLVVGPAFSTPPTVTDDLPIINFVPEMLTDEKGSGGGEQGPPPAPGPKAKEQALQQQAPAPTPKLEVAPPEPKTPVKQPIKEPEVKTIEPAPEEIKKAADPDDVVVEPPKTKKPPKPERELNLKPVERKNSSESSTQKKAAKEAADRRAKVEATQAWNKQLDQSLGNIRGGLSSSISMDGVMGGKGSGTGTGGPAYANWAQFVISIYDNAWVAPEDVADNSLTVKVKVVVARDGQIVSDDIVKRSGNATLDRSIKSVLERISSVPGFPKGATEERRTIYINFNLHAKRMQG